MKKTILLLSLLVGTLPAFSFEQQKTGSIEGTVIDLSTQQPLPGANIVIVDSQFGAATNAYGKFVIENIPIGTYNIKVSMIGYQTKVITEIVVSANRVIMANFELNESALELEDEVVVTDEYFDKEPGKPISAKRLTPQEIRSSAGSAEDIFRIIQSMPGVSGAGGKSSNCLVLK